MKTVGYAAQSPQTPLAPFTFARRALRSNDVTMEVLYCGVCHSDLHTARNDWGWTTYPIVPGHGIVGRVTAVGSEVGRYKVGDTVAVGCMVDSCQQCDQCNKGESNSAAKATPAPIAAWTGSPMSRPRAATPNIWWSARSLCCGFPSRWTSPKSLRCYVPALPLSRRCAPGTWYPAAASVSSASVAWAIWRSNWPPAWARK